MVIWTTRNKVDFGLSPLKYADSNIKSLVVQIQNIKQQLIDIEVTSFANHIFCQNFCGAQKSLMFHVKKRVRIINETFAAETFAANVSCKRRRERREVRSPLTSAANVRRTSRSANATFTDVHRERDVHSTFAANTVVPNLP